MIGSGRMIYFTKTSRGYSHINNNIVCQDYSASYHDDEKTIITQYLKKVIEFNPQKIILGCTHYPYLLEQLTKYIEPEVFINPAKIFANYIKQDLLRNNMNTSNKIGNIEYFASSNIEEFKENSKLFFEIENTPELITI